jgi:hypothetical protein
MAKAAAMVRIQDAWWMRELTVDPMASLLVRVLYNPLPISFLF